MKRHAFHDGDDVALVKVSQRWNRLRKAVRTSIIAGLDRVRALRLDIARAAQIDMMPRVRVVDVAWVGPNYEGIAHGRSIPMRHGHAWEYGVEVPAPTVIFTSDEALRGILLHEFSHCFNAERRVIAQFVAGRREFRDQHPTGGVFVDEQWDLERLDPPEVWFGPDDVSLFPYWHSHLLDPYADVIATEWIANDLPTTIPVADYEIDGMLRIPPIIIDHIRRTASSVPTSRGGTAP